MAFGRYYSIRPPIGGFLMADNNRDYIVLGFFLDTEGANSIRQSPTQTVNTKKCLSL